MEETITAMRKVHQVAAIDPMEREIFGKVQIGKNERGMVGKFEDKVDKDSGVKVGRSEKFQVGKLGRVQIGKVGSGW